MYNHAPCVCNKCGRGFCKSGNLKNHKRVHGTDIPDVVILVHIKPHGPDERKYTECCELCSHRFSQKANLKAHCVLCPKNGANWILQMWFETYIGLGRYKATNQEHVEYGDVLLLEIKKQWNQGAFGVEFISHELIEKFVATFILKISKVIVLPKILLKYYSCRVWNTSHNK